MNLNKLFKLHKRINNELGEDLVVSLVSDNGKYILAVSAHKSKQQFKTGRDMQMCEITDYDMKQNIDSATDEIIKMYGNMLYTPDDENENGETNEIV